MVLTTTSLMHSRDILFEEELNGTVGMLLDGLHQPSVLFSSIIQKCYEIQDLEKVQLQKAFPFKSFICRSEMSFFLLCFYL